MDLVRRIPPDQQSNLVLMTTIGLEFSLRAIIRVEEEYVVIRGRIAGTTDTGRVFFVPYDQINYIGYQSEVREAQIDALYGDCGPRPAPSEQPPAGIAVSVTAEGPPANGPIPTEVPPAPRPASPGRSSGRIPIPSKKALLERLRLRNRNSDNGPPSPAP